MNDIADIESDLLEQAEKRYDDFKIEEIDTIKKIYEDSYLESPVWVGGDSKFVCLFIDLDKSSKMSFKSHAKTMAKIYDYFTQTLFDVMSIEGIEAEYIDVKGDGVFGIFEGEDAVFRALSAAITFSTFFKKHIRPKFQTDDQPMNFKAALHVDKILVRRLGKRGARNNNEVWAGRLVNKASKLAAKTADIYEATDTYHETDFGLLVISDKAYKLLEAKREYAIECCGHDMAGNEINPGHIVWEEFDTSLDENLSESKIYYAPAIWCEICRDQVNQGLLS
ncbi:hypothetical protein FJZ39_03340 [Candidatus Saccharibacteria bacterium]|nr:hypothetical protein [Candidatus Saccharibacteria bacterium]